MVKQSVARRLPVYMQDNAGAPVLGLAWDDVTVFYAKESDTNLSEKILAASPVEWFEIGQGLYKILFTATELNTIEFFEYFVTGGTALQYPGLVQISANLVDDVAERTNNLPDDPSKESSVNAISQGRDTTVGGE